MLMRITSIFLRTSFKGVVSRNYTNGFKMLSIIFSFITRNIPVKLLLIYTARKRSWGKVIFLHMSVGSRGGWCHTPWNHTLPSIGMYLTLHILNLKLLIVLKFSIKTLECVVNGLVEELFLSPKS